MFSLIRRVLIILAVAVLAFFWFQKSDSEGDKPINEKELQKQLTETINREWDALVAGDWLTVYEIADPQQKPPLTTFMQGRDKFYFKNWKLLETQLNGDVANVTIQHDWGVILDMEIDLGTPEKKGAVKNEVYRYDHKDKKWYHRSPEKAPESEPKRVSPIK